jgi:hypothetical protein
MYTLSSDGSSTLEISAEGTHHVATLSGGSTEASGAAAPADCYIRAVGKLEGKVLVARFVPVETETFMYTKSQSEQEQRQLKIIFGLDTADVVQADTFGYCGLGASVVGRYRRQKTAP